MTALLIEEGYINDVISAIYCKLYNSIKADSEISFDISSAIKIIDKSAQILQTEPSILEIDTITDKTDIIIVGDIHGNLESLVNLFQVKGDPTTTKYLFLGDYVDRGQNSCEVIILLYAFKCLYPENIYLIRGNHEFRDMNDQYGFKDECYKRIKYKNNNENNLNFSKLFYKKITKSFQHLPICAILNNKIFCVHGGISALIDNRKELMNIKKVGIQYTKYDSVQAEFFWNDPDQQIKTYQRSSRGIGCIFGDVALKNFLNAMNFDVVIRAHQCQMNGFEWNFGESGNILTVFSAHDYCGISNDGAVAIVSYDNKIQPCKFELNSMVLLPEKIIQNNFAFLDDVLFDQSFNIENMDYIF